MADRNLVVNADGSINWDALGAHLTEYIHVTNYGVKGDDSTDDITAINALLTSLGTNQKTIYFPPNKTYIIGSQLNVPSNTRLIIDGTIKLKNEAKANMLYLNGVTNVVIEGSGTIDGNRANQTSPPSPIAGIYVVPGCSYVTIKGLTIKNCYNWAVNVVQSNNVLLDSIVTSYSGNSTEFAQNSYDCYARNIEVHHIDDYGFAFYGGCYNCGITDSILHHNNIDGISLISDSGQPYDNYDISIIGNTCYNNNYSGISLISHVASPKDNYSITIIGNKLHHNNQSNIAGQGGIWVRNATKVTIKGNTIHHDGNGGNSSVGINVNPQTQTVTDIIITDNTIYNEGQPSSGLGVGIQLLGANYVVIQNNVFKDTQTSKTTAYHINGSSTNFIVQGNLIGTSLGAILNITPNATTVIKDNKGGNPKGAIAPPATLVSSTSIQNTTGYMCRVFVSNGTVTNIAINDAFVNMTHGSFLLYPGDSIQIVYSATPDWFWYAM